MGKPINIAQPGARKRHPQLGKKALLALLRCAVGSVWLCTVTLVCAQEDPAPRSKPDSASLAGTESDSKSSDEASARAAAEMAKVEFNRGNQAYERGNYRKAAEAFEEAHRLSPHSAVLFNAARAWWKMGESERAADDYAEAIRRGELTSEQTLRARSALASLRKKLGWIIVSGPTGSEISVGYRQNVPAPLTTHLTPGQHILQVRLNEESWEQVVTVKADAPLSVVTQRQPADKALAQPGPESPLPPTSKGSSRQKTWGWVTLGVGAALGVGAGVTGLFTLNARNEFNQLNDGSKENFAAAQERRDEAKTWRTVTNVLAFSGGAAALTGFTLVLTAPKANSPSHSTRSTPAQFASPQILSITIGPGRVEMLGRF